jgi:hypothetical protein
MWRLPDDDQAPLNQADTIGARPPFRPGPPLGPLEVGAFTPTRPEAPWHPGALHPAPPPVGPLLGG